MLTLKKHIAFLLFGIFFFPIIFQSFHIVWSHSHVYKCEEHNNSSKTISNKDFIKYSKYLSETEDTCNICEYQFSINDLPKISFFTAGITVFEVTHNKVATKEKYNQIFSVKTPRAPPVLIS